MQLRTTVSREGKFLVGEHKPHFFVKNFRKGEKITSLGVETDGTRVTSAVNFPQTDINVSRADTVYEIPNPFPFRGTTYINARWADKNARAPEKIALQSPPPLSFLHTVDTWLEKTGIQGQTGETLLELLPEPLLLALANSSTDPDELVKLACMSCSFVFAPRTGTPLGLVFKKQNNGKPGPDIKHHDLFEALANNIHLPDAYKAAMVLKPGVQGTSPITGEWQKNSANREEPASHVYEYLRENSYIPWGHFAANTADDTVRYRAGDLVPEDMRGMRRLFYQRIYSSLAQQLALDLPLSGEEIFGAELENLRLEIIKGLNSPDRPKLQFNGCLWGWNFGFGFAHSGYRLHASHQQIHQQYAMVPEKAAVFPASDMPSFACGDMVAEFVEAYQESTGKGFFDNYLAAIRSNQRVDREKESPSDLVVHEDDNIILFVPKAQTSQWELQMMPLRPCGNILEADDPMRNSLDRGILTALQTLEAMGAEMVTSIEFSKRFDSKHRDQRLLYSFLPKIPYSPGAFSEAQQRWINGHYPEDFAIACRAKLIAAQS